MIDQADIDSHIADFQQIKDRIDAIVGPGMSPEHRTELALTVMRVHEMHRSEHLHHRRPD